MIFSYTKAKMLSSDLFFSLSRFPHATLWKEGEPVWSPLFHLKSYLKQLPLGKIQIDIPAGVTLVHPEWISIGEGTILEPGVMIQGPCFIGKKCSIRHGALLRGGVICSDRTVIGHSAEVKHSILMEGSCVTHFVYVGDSIIGNGANLAAGVKCANLRLDRKEVTVHFEGIKMGTGLMKMGAIVGDGAQIGCNCVLNPGSLIGRETICHPLLNFSGYAPPCSQIKGNMNWKVESADPKALLERMGQ